MGTFAENLNSAQTCPTPPSFIWLRLVTKPGFELCHSRSRAPSVNHLHTAITLHYKILCWYGKLYNLAEKPCQVPEKIRKVYNMIQAWDLCQGAIGIRMTMSWTTVKVKRWGALENTFTTFKHNYLIATIKSLKKDEIVKSNTAFYTFCFKSLYNITWLLICFDKMQNYIYR